MQSNQYVIRPAKQDDALKIYNLYQNVGRVGGGLARTDKELTRAYVDGFTNKAFENGIQFVAVEHSNPQNIVAEIHCYKLEPAVFSHVLSDLTIAVDPHHQGMGLGRQIFTTLLDYIVLNRPDILRVELLTRESNLKAIKLYESLGFKTEGKLRNRIKTDQGQFIADVPMGWFNPNFSPDI